MNLCSNKHEEVCYESRKCPVCELAADKDDKIAELEDKIAELAAEVEQLQNAQ